MRSSTSGTIAAIIIGFFVLSITTWSESAWALDLQQAKSQGLVGERLDGYLGIVKPAAGVQSLLDKINSGRRDYYRDIAKRNGTSQDVVEALAGKKAIQKTPAGQYIQNASGGWIKK